MLKVAAGLEPARGYDADRMKLKKSVCHINESNARRCYVVQKNDRNLSAKYGDLLISGI